MASSIDATKPTAGAALTADVRNNFSAAKTEIEALQTAVAAAGDFKRDGSVAMTGAIQTTVGTMTSSVANGATAVGFNRNTTNTFSTSGAILDRVQNNGTTVWSIDKDGTISLAAASNALKPGIVASDAATTGISMGSAGGNQAVWIYANNTLVAKANNKTFSCYRLGLGLAGDINNFTAGLWSPSSGLVNVTDGGTTNLRDLKARSLISSGGTITLSNYTVATLPTAASNAHAIVAVTDGNASPTYRGAVTGGGSTKGVVYCDGSSWMWH